MAGDQHPEDDPKDIGVHAVEQSIGICHCQAPLWRRDSKERQAGVCLQRVC